MTNQHKKFLSPHREVPEHAKLRVCLKCDQEFMSLGPLNRICPKCDGGNARQSRRAKQEKGGARGTRATRKGDEVQ